LIAPLADALGIDRQELLLISYPEVEGLVNSAVSVRPAETPSWRNFIGSPEPLARHIGSPEPLARHHVTKRELRTLGEVCSLGTKVSIRQFLAILMLLRDVPEHS
jgi:hypothetical protein